MNNTFFKRLSTITTGGYIALVIVVAVFAFKFDEQIMLTEVINRSEMDQLRPLFNRFFLLIGILATTGMLAIISLLAAERFKASEETIVVENFNGTAHKDEENKSQEEDEAKAFEKAKTEIDTILASEGGEIDQAKMQKMLSTVCNHLQAAQGALYLSGQDEGLRIIKLTASYAYTIADSQVVKYEYGEGIAGQVAKEGRSVKLDNVPEGYITILSGLGSSSPSSLAIIPFKNKLGDVFGVVEISSFKSFSENEVHFLEEVFNKLGEGLSSSPVA